MSDCHKATETASESGLYWVRRSTRFDVYPQREEPFLLYAEKSRTGLWNFSFPAGFAYAGTPYRQSLEIVRPFRDGEPIHVDPLRPTHVRQGRASDLGSEDWPGGADYEGPRLSEH